MTSNWIRKSKRCRFLCGGFDSFQWSPRKRRCFSSRVVAHRGNGRLQDPGSTKKEKDGKKDSKKWLGGLGNTQNYHFPQTEKHETSILLAHPKKYARDHLCKHKYLSIYTCDTQMMHFWLFRQKHVFCFHSNHSDGDNYCLLLRIGFFWNFGDLQVSKEVHQSQPHLAQPTCIHCPQTIAHRLMLLKVHANSASYLMFLIIFTSEMTVC